MNNKDPDFATWIGRNPAPSLAELIKKQGSYGAIPKRAWRTFEAEYAHWEEQRKTRVRCSKSPDHFHPLAVLGAPDCSKCRQENYQHKTSTDRETEKPLAHDWPPQGKGPRALLRLLIKP